MEPVDFLLYSSRPDLHDRLAETPGDFSRVIDDLAKTAAAGRRVRVFIQVNYRSFGLLGETIRLAAGLIDQPLDGDLRFRPTYNKNLDRDVRTYLADLEKLLTDTPLKLRVSDEDPLFEIIGRLRGAVDHESDADVLRLFGALTGGVFVGPRVFHVDVSNRCNTDCVYCWFHSEFSADRPDAERFDEKWRAQRLDWDLYTRLIDDLAELRTCEDIVLSGKGEPLTHPRALDMVAYAKQRGMKVTLFTNGILLNEKTTAFLIEHQTDLLYLSLSAHDADSYAALRVDPPANEFDRIIDGCLRLKRQKEEAGSRLPELVLVSILNNRNCTGVIDFARLAAKLGADHLRYQLTAIETYNRSLMLSPEQLNQLRQDLDEVRQIAQEARINLIQNIDFQLSHGADDQQDWSGDYFLEQGCYAGFLFGRVWAGGETSFCCVPKVVGSLEQTPFAELWFSDRYQRYRNDARDIAGHKDTRFADGSTLFDPRCLRCPNYEQIQWLLDLAHRLNVDGWLR